MFKREELGRRIKKIRVARGMTLAIVGPNGAGKTTLLKILLGLLEGYTGSVKIEGLAPEKARRHGVAAWVPQRSRLNTAFPITVRQLAQRFPGCPFGVVENEGGKRVDAIEAEFLEHIVQAVLAGLVAGGERIDVAHHLIGLAHVVAHQMD